MNAESITQRQVEYLGEQITRMEAGMIDPREFGRLEGEVKALSGQVTDLAADVKKLLELANQSKGGLWVGMTFSSAVGALVMFLAQKFFGK